MNNFEKSPSYDQDDGSPSPDTTHKDEEKE